MFTSAPFDEISPPAANAFGEAAFFGELAWPEADYTNFRGVWAELGGRPLDLVARQGDSAPGTGGNFKDFSHNPVIGLGGHVAFSGIFFGTGIDSSNDEAIWVASPTGELTAVVREGEIAPGTGRTFRSFTLLSVNPEGDLAFTPGLSPGSSKDSSAIWRYSNLDGAVLVAMQGEIATSHGDAFASNHGSFESFRNPVLGDGGHLTFDAKLLDDHGSKTSVWLEHPSGQIEIVAKVGDPAPGTNDAFTSLGHATVNARGQVAFSGRTVNYWHDHYGIWAHDQQGVLQSIVLAGELLDVSDDPAMSDLRTVEYLSFREAGNFAFSNITGFNDLGQVAFFARFTDGTSGVFVSNAVAVPEPSSLWIFALLAFVGRRCDG